MWCAIAACLVFSTRHARLKRSEITVEAVRIAVVDTADTRVVTAEKVRRWLAEDAIDPAGRPIDSAGTREIELRLATRPEVGRVSAWTDLDGRLTVRVEGRTPAMRVRTAGGYSFWFTRDGVIIPDRGDFAAYVPVVTGGVAWPFAPTAEGSYAGMQAAAYNDFLDRFTAIDAERRSLESRAGAIRSEIRAIRTSTPKRWWSAERKKTFTEGKAVRIAELEKSAAELSAELAKITALEKTLREKEKKSRENFRFLSKLANFVGFIESSDFWSAQIVQIHVAGGGETSGEGWREPSLELIPRAGDHTVILGELDGAERERLANLRLFYEKGLWHEGWNEYGHINIEYRNQIVCTK
jgi:cell division protein FtsQ